MVTNAANAWGGTRYPASVFGAVTRICQLNSAGAPLVGSQTSIVTDAFVKMTVDPVVERGVDIFNRDASGNAGVSFKSRDLVKRGLVQIDFQVPDPEFESLFGGTLLTDSTAQVSAPSTQITGAPSASGGFVPAGTTHFYGATAFDEEGETTIGGVSAAVTTTGSASSVVLTLAAAPTGGLGQRIYRSDVSATGPWQYVGEIAAATLTFTDTLLAGGTQSPPTANGTAGSTGVLGSASATLLVAAAPNGVSIEVWANSIFNGGFANPYKYRRYVLPQAFLTEAAGRTFATEQLMNPYDGDLFANSGWGTGPDGDWPFSWTGVGYKAWSFTNYAPAPEFGRQPIAI